MQFFSLLVAAVVIEGIISYIKLFFVNGKFQWQVIVAIALGILVAVSYQIDIFKLVGMVSVIPHIGVILSGILISRGSNYIYEIIKLLMSHTEKLKLGSEAIKNDRKEYL